MSTKKILIINSGLCHACNENKIDQSSKVCLFVIKLMFVGSSISNNLNTCTEDKLKISQSFWRSCTASCWMDSKHFSCRMFEVMIVSPWIMGKFAILAKTYRSLTNNFFNLSKTNRMTVSLTTSSIMLVYDKITFFFIEWILATRLAQFLSLGLINMQSLKVINKKVLPLLGSG